MSKKAGRCFPLLAHLNKALTALRSRKRREKLLRCGFMSMVLVGSQRMRRNG
jgi:hypothetical protein